MRDKKPTSAWAVLKPLLRQYMGPEKATVGVAVLCGVLAASAAGFGMPFIIQHVCPIVFGEAPAPVWLKEWIAAHFSEENESLVLLCAAALFIPLVMFMRGMFTYLNAYLLTLSGMRILTRLRTDVFAKLQWLSFSFHDRNKRGGLMTTVIQYTQGLQGQMVSILNDLVIQPLTLLSATGYLVYAAAESEASAMLLGNLLLTSLCVPLVRMVGKKVIKEMRSALAGMNVITETVEETFSAQREVRAFNLEARQEGLLRRFIRQYNMLILKMSAWQQSLSPAVEIVSALALSYSLFRSSSYGLTLESFSAIAVAFYYCYDPIKRLGMLANEIQLSQVMVGGINRVLEAKDETPEPTHPVSLPTPVRGDVDFNGVSFGYSDKVTVLRDINIHVPGGQIVALVGPSGSGKTTFINLVCRFYDVNKGSVCIDGVDVRKLKRHERVNAIGLVSQFPALFRDTIGENIRVGRPGAGDPEVRLAGHRACVDEFIHESPEGYGRMLAEGGGGLSGGQRQRVSIARAFLKNAPILILDEATSALDMKSEALIQGALADLAAGHTTFIIAHRFSTIRMAQRILVFEAGRIVADGTHERLYENCALYRHLYDEQVRQANEREKEAAC